MVSCKGGAGREARGPSLTFCIIKIFIGSNTKPNVLLNANPEHIGLGKEVQGSGAGF